MISKPAYLTRFGVQRATDPQRSTLERWFFRVFGIIDPAHYLHHRYVQEAMSRWLHGEPELILDAGCGRGDYSIWLASRFPDASVLGVDIDEERQRRNQISAMRLGLRNLEFRTESIVDLTVDPTVDLVVSVDVLEHVPEQNRAIANLGQLLGDRGIFIAHIPCKRPTHPPLERFLSEFAQWAEHEHVAEELTAEEFVAAFRSQGLDVIEYRTTFSYWLGELATSLFNVPFQNTARNRIAQIALAPFVRALAYLDTKLTLGPTFAVLIVARRAGQAER